MSVAAIVGELLLGWLLADLIGGLLHWVEDRLLRPGWPLLDRLVVVPNRLHHSEPTAFTRDGLWSRNSTTWPFALAFGAAWLVLAGPSPMWASATLGGLLMSQVHYWAHVRSRPRWVDIAQRVGLFQSRAHHWSHHAAGVGAYCILTDWLNPVLDELRFWGRLEAALAAIGVRVDPELVR